MAEVVVFIGSDTTVPNIWDIVRIKVSEQD